MELFAQFKNKKILLSALIIITIPLWLPLVSYTFTTILNAGRYVGTMTRLINSSYICPM